MNVGYARVSTTEQHTSQQDVILNEFGVAKVFTDIVSGKDAARPELKKMLDSVRDGDCLVVESYFRLARSVRDFLDITDTLREKGVDFVSIKESIDTRTPKGRLFFVLAAGISSFERECLLERQREGIAHARAAGKYRGRVPVEYDHQEFGRLYRSWKAGEMTAVAMQQALGFKPSTFYRRVAEYEAGATK